MSMAWTEEQAAAIAAQGKEILVAAAAGAGKTAVLVERVIRQVVEESHPVDIDRLLVLTFTNAAAAQMRERVRQAVDQALAAQPGSLYLRRQQALVSAAPITTMHAFCLDVLRRYFYLVDLEPGFRVADNNETALIQADVMDELFEERYAAGDAAFDDLVDTFGGERDDAGLARLIHSIYDFARSTPATEAWLRHIPAVFAQADRGDIDSLPWVVELHPHVVRRLTMARQLIQQALQAAAAPGGPASYMPVLHDDLARLEAALRAASSWSALAALLPETASFPRLKPCRGNGNPHWQELAKQRRQEAKKIIQTLQRDFFGRTPREILEDMHLLVPRAQALADLAIQYGRYYQRAKRERGVVDFADLEHYCLAVLSGPEGEQSPVAQDLRRQYQEILVDEYQDINAVQERIIRLLAGQDELPVFMVGDVKQSIYRFRLADPSLFLSKYRTFSTAPAAPRRRINLTTNFRSRAAVVDAVNFVFRQIMTEGAGEINYGPEEELVCRHAPAGPNDASAVACHFIVPPPDAPDATATAEMEQAETVPVKDDADEVEELTAFEYEARLITKLIKDMTRTNDGTAAARRYRDIAVLLRAPQNKAAILLETLQAAGIPAYAELGSGYFRTVEIETMLALLAVIDNPRQDVALAAVLRAPFMGLTADALARVRLCDRQGDYYAAVVRAAQGNDALALKLREFLARLDSWRTAARRGPLPELIWQIYRDTGYYDFVGSAVGGIQRQANLRALYDRARQFEATSFHGLFKFLRYIDRLREQGEDLAAARALGENEDVVRIMSIHKSKGLEFPVVILADLAKQFNQRDLHAPVLLDREMGLGFDVVDTQLGYAYPSLPKQAIREKKCAQLLAEEMRLLYVAMTRAQDRLVLVGTLAKPAAAAGRWCAMAASETWALSDHGIAAAKSFLDWLGVALVRHRDGASLRELAPQGVVPEIVDAVYHDRSRWDIRLWTPQECLDDTAAAPADNALLTAATELAPLPVEQDDQAVARIFTWRYSHAAAVGKPVKMSVSELKRRFDMWPQEEIVSVTPRNLAVRPHFMEGAGLTATERGAAFHLLLQHIPLVPGIDKAAVQKYVQVLQEQDFLTYEQADMLSAEAENIAAFFAQPLGQRMVRAPFVRRELPFSLLLPAAEVYHETALAGENVFLQGVIDCLFQDDQGLVLLEYKTDRSEVDLDTLVARYRTQVALYERAVTTILKQPVQERYLYFLDRRRVVSL